MVYSTEPISPHCLIYDYHKELSKKEASLALQIAVKGQLWLECQEGRVGGGGGGEQRRSWSFGTSG